MIGDQRPGIAVRIGLDEQTGESLDEIAPISVGAENIPAFDTANDNVLQQAGNIEAGLTGHGGKVAKRRALFNN